jgi:hypothetical protein
MPLSILSDLEYLESVRRGNGLLPRLGSQNPIFGYIYEIQRPPYFIT